jgi:hypothetical protein
MAFSRTLLDANHPGGDMRIWDIIFTAHAADLAYSFNHGLKFTPSFVSLTPLAIAVYTDHWYVSAITGTSITVERADHSAADPAPGAFPARLAVGRIPYRHK